MTTIENMVRQHQNWLDQAEGLVDRKLRYLREDLNDGDLVSMINISDALGSLATYYGISGMLSNHTQLTTKNDYLSHSIIYRFWALKIRAKHFSKTYFLRGTNKAPNLTNQMSNAACLLACFIAIEKDDKADFTADILEGMFTTDGAINANYLKERRFEPFMMWLYSAYSGKTLSKNFEFREYGVYQKLIDSWHSPELISDPILELCDYHLVNSDDTGGRRDPEFKNSPFDLLPFEIWAIFSTRKKLGMVMPEIDHPLLSFSKNIKDDLHLVPDDLALEIEAAYNSIFNS
ncbi:hypothetical protein E4656_10435 [Natronospirillum operosum]|uniref:Uncharacterized protein n=1 Tax=Natronospirillum operosum TaxID=2759953 RepID=A0A4Z0WE58_9GAMM|nr:hypothetical protein [Natronospirillum operosum]TGG93456.1 hypothetical protein E4656_10435 [Natronospirillum operosum]